MATYTVAQIKDLTSVPAVKGWSDDKILLFQATAESIIDSLQMDTSLSGYAAAYNSLVMLILDWVADNPTGLRQSGKGKVSKSFSDILPPHIMVIVKKFTDGTYGFFQGSEMQRSDMGLS